MTNFSPTKLEVSMQVQSVSLHLHLVDPQPLKNINTFEGGA